jgi:restriction endonuclease Mrr
LIAFKEFMLPLLKIAADGREHTLAEAMETLAVQMGISEEEQELMLPSQGGAMTIKALSRAYRDLSRSNFPSIQCAFVGWFDRDTRATG